MQLKLNFYLFEIEWYNITMFYVIVMIAHKEIIYKIEEKGNEKEMKACQYKKSMKHKIG